jgi:hypothetical protein
MVVGNNNGDILFAPIMVLHNCFIAELAEACAVRFAIQLALCITAKQQPFPRLAVPW